ncbi:MAG: hypothetical protein ACTIA6_04320 [Pseudoclavibacter sp.]
MNMTTRIGSIVATAGIALGGVVLAAAPAQAETGFTQVSGGTLTSCIDKLHSTSAQLAQSGKRTTSFQGCYEIWNPFGDAFVGGVYWTTVKQNQS